MEKTGYFILIDIYEDGELKRTETPAVNRVFQSKKAAVESAYWMADDECTSLNDGWAGYNPLISYGVVDFESNQGFVSTNKYILESEEDSTGETEILTKYRVIECIIEEPQI